MPRIFLSSLCTIAVLAVSSATAADSVAFRQDGRIAILENKIVRVEFDLAAGSYRAFDSAMEAAASATAASPSVTGPRLKQAALAEPRTGRLATLWARAERWRSNAPIRAGRPYCWRSRVRRQELLALRGGIINTTGQSLRVKDFYPLTAARAFPEAGEIGRAKTLNGEGGGRNTSVQSGPARSSSNNVLMTFRKGDRRRSVVLGGLSYHDWMKWAAVWPSASAPSDNAIRLRELNARIARAGGKLDAYFDCGVEPKASAASRVLLAVLRGSPYDFASVFAAPCYNTVLFDDKQVQIAAEGMDPKKHYVLGFSWWDYSSDGRIESVSLTPGDGSSKTTLVEKATLPAYALVHEQLPVEKAFDVPPALYASGKMKIQFTFEGAARARSQCGGQRSLADRGTGRAGGKDRDADGRRHSPEGDGEGGLSARQGDGSRRTPRGSRRAVPAGGPLLRRFRHRRSIPSGGAVRPGGSGGPQATPNPYTFPTICSWYAGVTFEPDAHNHPEKSRYGIATTRGHVEEMDYIRKTDFLDFSTVALVWCPTTTPPTIRRDGGTTNTGKNKGFIPGLMKPRKNGGKPFRRPRIGLHLFSIRSRVGRFPQAAFGPRAAGPRCSGLHKA